MTHRETCSPHPGLDAPPPHLATPDVAKRESKNRETSIDAILLRRCADGDHEAMAELHSRLGGMLHALAMRITGDWRDAEDTVQEALLYAWKKAGSYDPKKASVSTWLVLITRSRALDKIRKRKAFVQAEVPLSREDIDVGIEPEGFGRTLQSHRSQRIREALRVLPEEQKQVLKLQFFLGLTQKEGALRLGIPLGTFKTRVLLAMKKLRRELHTEVAELT